MPAQPDTPSPEFTERVAALLAGHPGSSASRLAGLLRPGQSPEGQAGPVLGALHALQAAGRACQAENMHTAWYPGPGPKTFTPQDVLGPPMPDTWLPGDGA